MSKSSFLLLAFAIFVYFGLIILALAIAYPYGMIVLVALGGMLLLGLEAILNRAPRKPNDSLNSEIVTRETLKFSLNRAALVATSRRIGQTRDLVQFQWMRIKCEARPVPISADCMCLRKVDLSCPNSMLALVTSSETV